jgi:hypothetical protein
MNEQNTPVGADEATRMEASNKTASLIDQAADLVEQEANEPETPPQPVEKPTAEIVEETDEAETPGDAEPQGEQPEAEGTVTEPDAATPQGHPFTPEEEQLLRRSQATPEDVDYYRTLTVEQRNRALNPLRNAVRNQDRFFGLSPEERNREIERARGSDAAQFADAKAGPSPSPKLEADPAKIKALAERLGIEEAAAKEIVDAALDPIRQFAAQRQAEQAQAAQNDWSRKVETAAEAAHVEIAKAFPKLKDKFAFEALLGEPETFATFDAKVRSGVDVGKAMLDAARERATVKYFPEIQQQRQAAREADKTKAIKQTAEPTSKTLKRGPATGQPRVKSLDEAHERVMAESD